MMLSYFLPPLALMATPTWLARLLLGDGRLYRVVTWFTHPVVAAVVFNAIDHDPAHPGARERVASRTARCTTRCTCWSS